MMWEEETKRGMSGYRSPFAVQTDPSRARGRTRLAHLVGQVGQGDGGEVGADELAGVLQGAPEETGKGAAGSGKCRRTEQRGGAPRRLRESTALLPLRREPLGGTLTTQRAQARPAWRRPPGSWPPAAPSPCSGSPCRRERGNRGRRAREPRRRKKRQKKGPEAWPTGNAAAAGSGSRRRARGQATRRPLPPPQAGHSGRKKRGTFTAIHKAVIRFLAGNFHPWTRPHQ